MNKNLAAACVGLALGLAGSSLAFAGEPGFHCYQDPSDGQTYCQVCSATGDAPLQCGPWTEQPAIEFDQIPPGGGPGSGMCDPGFRTVIAPDGSMHNCPIPCAYSNPPSDPVCLGGGMLGGGGGGGGGGFGLLP
jgi:hypothetical protein